MLVCKLRVWKRKRALSLSLSFFLFLSLSCSRTAKIRVIVYIRNDKIHRHLLIVYDIKYRPGSFQRRHAERVNNEAKAEAHRPLNSSFDVPFI